MDSGWVWFGAFVALVFGTLYFGLFEVWRVPSDDPTMSLSMTPALKPGDLVLIARHGEVSRGDLARCPDPQAAGRFVIARAIGEPREVIDIVNEKISLDDKWASSPHACDSDRAYLLDPASGEEVTLRCFTEHLGEGTYDTLRSETPDPVKTHETIEPGKVFMVSDNRHFHLDSRDYGTIADGTCQHVVFRLWGKGGFFDPAGRFSVIW